MSYIFFILIYKVCIVQTTWLVCVKTINSIEDIYFIQFTYSLTYLIIVVHDIETNWSTTENVMNNVIQHCIAFFSIEVYYSNDISIVMM